ncbi:uncharacterized protein LOC118749931 [Rhagoletis pomonella]|uniref:uncharacterized protein LOC118749931 n=1 Tax=Rhagoletis pomonella TaxID=28610 RepID=UPI00178403D7|nr:uncharacterized protein LOC118749931 [Rhagoletis pomonella]
MPKKERNSSSTTTTNQIDSIDSSTLKTTTPSTTISSTNTNASSSGSEAKSKKSPIPRCVLQNPDPVRDNSYAGILKGQQAANSLTADSAKYRKLCDAIDTPSKLFDERQFPPVAIAARD